MATILMVDDTREANNLLRPHEEDEGRRVIRVFDGQRADTNRSTGAPTWSSATNSGQHTKGGPATRILCRSPTVRSCIMRRAVISGWVAQRLKGVIEAAWAETLVYGCWRVKTGDRGE